MQGSGNTEWQRRARLIRCADVRRRTGLEWRVRLRKRVRRGRYSRCGGLRGCVDRGSGRGVIEWHLRPERRRYVRGWCIRGMFLSQRCCGFRNSRGRFRNARSRLLSNDGSRLYRCDYGGFWRNGTARNRSSFKIVSEVIEILIRCRWRCRIVRGRVGVFGFKPTQYCTKMMKRIAFH